MIKMFIKIKWASRSCKNSDQMQRFNENLFVLAISNKTSNRSYSLPVMVIFMSTFAGES